MAKNRFFSKGVISWFWSKNLTFSYRRVLQKVCQKRSFFDIVDRKEKLKTN